MVEHKLLQECEGSFIVIIVLITRFSFYSHPPRALFFDNGAVCAPCGQPDAKGQDLEQQIVGQ